MLYYFLFTLFLSLLLNTDHTFAQHSELLEKTYNALPAQLQNMARQLRPSHILGCIAHKRALQNIALQDRFFLYEAGFEQDQEHARAVLGLFSTYVQHERTILGLGPTGAQEQAEKSKKQAQGLANYRERLIDPKPLIPLSFSSARWRAFQRLSPLQQTAFRYAGYCADKQQAWDTIALWATYMAQELILLEELKTENKEQKIAYLTWITIIELDIMYGI